METTVLIIISSLCLAGLLILILILLFKKPSKVEAPSIDLKEIGAISKQLELLSNDMKCAISLPVR